MAHPGTPPTPDQITLVIQQLLIEQGTLTIGDTSYPFQILERDGNKLHFRFPFDAEVVVQVGFQSFGALVDPEVEQELRRLLEEFRPGIVPVYTSCDWHGQCWALEYPGGTTHHHCNTIQDLLHRVRTMLANKLRSEHYYENPRIYEERQERILGLVMEGIPNRKIIPIINEEFPEAPVSISALAYHRKRARERLAMLGYISSPLVGLIESRINGGS